VLGRDHAGLDDDSIEWIMAGARAKAERPINDRASRNAVDELPPQYSEINPPPADLNEARDAGHDTEKPPPLPFINMSNWDNESVPEQEWAVPDRIPLGQTTLFTGEGGYGKSTVQLHLCAAHALGLGWLNTLPEPGPAVFFEAEDGERTIHRRLAAIATHYRVRFEDMTSGGLHVVSLFGRDAVLATPTRNGKVEPTRLYSQLLQAAGDIKPKMIGIASSANVFAGSEIDRTQTQQFIGLLNRVAVLANGAVVLIAHPSLIGINSDTGLSGSTQWHNAVRARFYLKGIKVELGEQPDNDLRELVFKKNQFGPMSANIVLRYRNGLFLPEKGASGLDKLAREAKADETFVDLLKRFANEGRNVSHNVNAKTYAPTAFAAETEAKNHQLRKADFENAMRRLFEAKKIRVENYGRPSQPHSRITIV
jgi:RecA-family ATPase